MQDCFPPSLNYYNAHTTHTFNMNSRFLLIAVMLSAAGVFSSCLQADLIEAEPLSYQTIVAEFEQPADEAQTRTCVDVNNPNTSFIGLLWQNNDKIGVYSQDGNVRNVEFTNTTANNVPQTEFGGEMSGTPYYAYYPYSADNANSTMTAIKGDVLAEQPFNPETGTLVCDYKYGARVSDAGNTFKFKQLFTMLRITIDATETGLEGERLNDIVLTVTDPNGNSRPVCGDFTFDIINGDWKAGSNMSNKVTMPWTTRPELLKGESYVGFITMMPVVGVNDKITIEVSTEGHKASFTATSKVAFESGYFYDIPLTLKAFKENSDKFGYKEETITRPAIKEFKFEISKNNTKLIDNELVWNSSKHTASFSTDISKTGLKAEIDDVKDEIRLTIPYLYDFKLKPTFALEGGTKVVAKVNGVSQTSGESEVDFTHPVTYSLVNSEGGSRDYTVKITNTGLPVVVIKHSSSGSFSKVYKDTWAQISGGTPYNQFVDFIIRGKDTDWVEDDQITVYNPDGTVDCDAYGGVRLRGNTSQAYPKKPFAIKLKEKASVLGMPEHKRWVLLANWLDHSMIRNAVAFDIAHVIEYAWRNSGGVIGDGIPWNVNGQHVELVVVDKDGDAHHVGNYYLCEQIKIDKNRLNITKPYDVEKPGVDDYTQYGHLLEIDGNYDEPSKFKTSKSVPFMFKDEVTTGIVNSVKEKVQRIETNIYKNTAAGFEAAFNELDINSVIDQMLIFELAMNREYGDPRSFYMYMDKDGKLSGGPVWDFDRGTFQNPLKAQELTDGKGPEGSSGEDYRVKSYNEWLYWRDGKYQETDDYSYVWYRGLAKSAAFQAKVQERWAVLKPYLDMIPEMINQYGEELAVSFEYDSKMWPTTKNDIRKYKDDFNDWSGDETIGKWDDVIANFVEVYQYRLAGMDALITSGSFTK